jgi:uncharacterized protein YoxC
MNITALAIIILGFMLIFPLSKIAHELEEIKKELWGIKK